MLQLAHLKGKEFCSSLPSIYLYILEILPRALPYLLALPKQFLLIPGPLLLSLLLLLAPLLLLCPLPINYSESSFGLVSIRFVTRLRQLQKLKKRLWIGCFRLGTQTYTMPTHIWNIVISTSNAKIISKLQGLRVTRTYLLWHCFLKIRSSFIGNSIKIGLNMTKMSL